MAKALGVNLSMVYHELKRNGGKRGGYTNYFMEEKLPKGKDADGLAKTVIGHILSITTDNGEGVRRTQGYHQETEDNGYFAHPYSAWEKDAIENFNKLFRQYIPKKADFNDFKQQDIMTFQ